jgi:hypothetical protein
MAAELILREVRCMRPPWFSEDQVALQKDGTVTISFVCNGQPGVLRTFYDTETCVARRRSASIWFLSK